MKSNKNPCEVDNKEQTILELPTIIYGSELMSATVSYHGCGAVEDCTYYGR